MAIRFAGMPVLITLLRAGAAVVAGRRSAVGCGWSAVGEGTQYIKTGFAAAYCRAAELELTLTTLGRA
jgi:hypothetical protein